jgi:DNA-binding NarL/FixJ family response regulator
VREITVLVCVRTKLAARTVASSAASLGVAGAVRTAVSDAEAMARLTELPADVVLADTAVTRPDSVGFTRRVLARSARATVVLFGPEDPAVAAATVAAGARGVIRGADQDLVSVVAKALLLLLAAGSPASAAVRETPAQGDAGSGADPNGTGSGDAGPGETGSADPLGTIVPTQRSDLVGLAGGRPAGGHTGAPGHAAPNRLAAGFRPTALPGLALGGAQPGAAPRRGALTERELQVLRGMADGKSNAEIGRELFVSEDTVKTHARRLFRKLGARDRAHAVAAGFRSGLVA